MIHTYFNGVRTAIAQEQWPGTIGAHGHASVDHATQAAAQEQWRTERVSGKTTAQEQWHESGSLSRILASVDRVRSRPMFYGQRGDDWLVSDVAEWVRDRVGDRDIDELVAAEFMLTGYVTGAETLYPNVKQLRAGEMLIEGEGKGLSVVRTERYYEFRHRDPWEESDDELTRRLDAVVLSVFERLIQSVEGRPIVVPLSAGFDSRLVVLMLHRLGVRDVICFSYGLEGNAESRVSRAIAERLGYRWLFVPYSPERWGRWFRSESRERYYELADGLCSIPHLQDWPAVGEMKRRRLILGDAVFVPGHTGDFLSGGHIPKSLEAARDWNREAVVRMIWDKHYTLNGIDVVGEEVAERVRARLAEQMAHLDIRTAEDAADAFEWWEWQERQAKYICNAVRVYEFWGYDWRMPLWDAEFMGFWERVPLRQRMGKRLYEDYVGRLGSALGLPRPNQEPVARRIVDRMLNRERFGPLRAGIKRALNEYDTHPLGWYGVMPRDLFQEHYSGREHLNSFLVREQLGRMTFEPAMTA